MSTQSGSVASFGKGEASSLNRFRCGTWPVGVRVLVVQPPFAMRKVNTAVEPASGQHLGGGPRQERIAVFRFGAVGLLVSREGMGLAEQETALEDLASRTWRIPGDGSRRGRWSGVAGPHLRLT